jgi:hypothetical protein
MAPHYDRQGRPISFAEWVGVFESADRSVARTEIGARVVSTVWLGLDHGLGDGPPMIFETMVFGPDGESEDCERYSTEAEALAGHGAMCARLEAQEK